MKKRRSAEMDDQVMGAAPQPRPLPSITVADLNPKDEPKWNKVKEKKRMAGEQISRALHEAMRYRPVMVKNRFAKLDSQYFFAKNVTPVIHILVKFD